MKYSLLSLILFLMVALVLLGGRDKNQRKLRVETTQSEDDPIVSEAKHQEENGWATWKRSNVSLRVTFLSIIGSISRHLSRKDSSAVRDSA